MKRPIRISIVLVIAFALIVGLFQVADGSSLRGGGGKACRVGWNTRTSTCLVIAPLYEGLGIKPLVGWNS
jgi:hypothetical protein